jgi:hypothetical protein
LPSTDSSISIRPPAEITRGCLGGRAGSDELGASVRLELPDEGGPRRVALNPGDPALQGRVEPKQPRVPAPTIDRPVQDLTGVAIANLEHPPE